MRWEGSVLDNQAQQAASLREADPFSVDAQLLPWTRIDTLMAGLLALAIFLVYTPTLQFGFVLDDIPLILTNPALAGPWRAVPRFFTEGFFDRLSPGTPANVYRPVFTLWLFINRRIWGFSPAGWHFSSVILLIVVSLVVFGIARGLFESRPLAAFAGLIFALHPVHVECTAWVTGANETLMAGFVASSSAAFLHVLKGGRCRAFWLGLSPMFFALGLLTKEEAIVLPALVAGIAWIYGRRGDELDRVRYGLRARKALRGSAPYWALTAAYLVLRFRILHGLSHTATDIALADLVRSIPLVIWRDFRLLLWPSGLTIFYDSPYVSSATLSNCLLPLSLVLALVAALVAWGRRSRVVQFSAIWCIIPLLPFLDLPIFPDGEFIHDRYLYLSSVGFGLLGAWAVRRATAFAKPRFKPFVLEASAAVLIGLVYGWLTVHDSRFWANEAMLFDRAMAVAPNSNFAEVQRAYEKSVGGQCDAAASLYRKVLARSPRYWRAYLNLGVCNYKADDYAMALDNLAKAAEIAPMEPDIYFYVGLAQFRLGQLAVSENALRRAIELRPDGAGFHLALGRVFKAEGATSGALGEFYRELAYHPGDAAAQSEITVEESHPARALK